MIVTLSDIAADIVKNACESGAPLVELEVTELGQEFRFLVRDNGKGMSHAEAKHAIDPLGDVETRDGVEVEVKHKKAGIGLPFLIQTVTEAAGGWDLHTEKGAGTTVAVWFDTDNPETPLTGDLAAMFSAVLGYQGPKEFIIRRIRKTGANDVRYELRKTELASALGGLADTESTALLSAYLHSLENGV
jgi:hypothetical protein